MHLVLKRLRAIIANLAQLQLSNVLQGMRHLFQPLVFVVFAAVASHL